MPARYLLRFDDICPTMNWAVWSQLQSVLDHHGIKPILAVVPDNQDPHLVAGPAREDFWQQVRDWQARHWTIALHGYRHLYASTDAGLLGINRFSEFAGTSRAEQRDKLDAGLAIFQREGVRADAWVAPAHAFDATTVALLLERGIALISDGFYARPVKHLGATWLPQQLWRFRPMPGGLWTVCYHHNHFDSNAVAAFARDVQRYADRIVSVADAGLAAAPARGFGDRLLAAGWLTALKLKRLKAGR